MAIEPLEIDIVRAYSSSTQMIESDGHVALRLVIEIGRKLNELIAVVNEMQDEMSRIPREGPYD